MKESKVELLIHSMRFLKLKVLYLVQLYKSVI